MSNVIKVYPVKNLSKVDKKLYKEGDHFITDRSIGVLANGTVKTIGNVAPDLSDYAKKEDIPDVSGLATKEEIPDVSSFLTAEQVQTMIDEAMNDTSE